MAQSQDNWYMTCINDIYYLITIPSMNKINTFFSHILQQTHQIYEKIAIIIQFGRERNSIGCALAGHGTWLWYQIWRTIHLAIMEEYMRMARQLARHTDGQLDWTHSYILWVAYCRARNNKQVTMTRNSIIEGVLGEEGVDVV